MSTLGRLNLIELEGYRSIKSMRLELSALNILIGPNGAGKSNFIGFFRFMNKLVQKDLQLYTAEQGGARKLLHFGLKKTKAMEARLLFRPNAYQCRLVPTNEGRFVFEKEYAWFLADAIGFSGGNKKMPLASTGASESALPSQDMPTIPGYVAQYLADWKVYHFHDTSSTAEVKQACKIRDNKYFREQGQNLAAFLYAIRQTSEYQQIVSTIQRVAPFFQDFILEPDLHDPESIRLQWKHKGSDDYFDAHDFSDGTLRFICLTTLLLQPHMPTMILLDEPELGLHPFAIQLLASLMRSASKRTQIIASTQSVTLANEFGWQDLIVVNHKDNESRFERLDEEQVKGWLDDYRMGELWEKNLLGGTPE